MTAPAADLTTALIVEQARGAARAGDLDEAVFLLAGLNDPAADDLLARVHAQRGDLAGADACWRSVQAADPAHPGAAAGRRIVEEIREGRRPDRPRLRPVPVAAATAIAAGLVAAGLVAAGLVAAGLTVLTGRDDGARPVAAPAVITSAPSPELLDQTRRADALQQRLDAAEAARRATTAAVAALQRRLTAVAGTDVRSRAADVQVVFDDGLFSGGDRLTGAGAAALTRVGRALRGTHPRITVVGHVVAVPGGRTRGGSRVALARAEIAAARLASASGLPLTAFTLVSADQRQGPHDTAAGNRTVSLLVAP